VADAKTTTKTAEPVDSAPKAELAPTEAPKQKVKTIDSGEPDIGWTAQAGSRPDELADRNPVVLATSELPDPAALAEQGIDPETYLANFTNVGA
jgi:hypothetical protein